MAPAKWTEVETSEAYKSAAPEVRQAIAERYFDKVVSQSEEFKSATPEIQAALRERLMARVAGDSAATPTAQQPPEPSPEQVQQQPEQLSDGSTWEKIKQVGSDIYAGLHAGINDTSQGMRRLVPLPGFEVTKESTDERKRLHEIASKSRAGRIADTIASMGTKAAIALPLGTAVGASLPVSGPVALAAGGLAGGAAQMALSPDADAVDVLTGGVVGGATGGVANFLPAPLKNKLATSGGAGLAGALLGLSQGNSLSERVENALSGFVIGAASGKLANKLAGGQPTAKPQAAPEPAPNAVQPFGKVGAQEIGPRAVELQKMGIDLPAASFAEETARGAVRRASTMRSTPEHAAAYAEQSLRTRESLNRWMNNSALEHIGESLPKNVAPGTQSNNYVAARISAQYEEVLPKIQARMTDKLAGSIQETILDASSKSLDDVSRVGFEKFVNNTIFENLKPNSPLNGSQLKQLRNNIQQGIDGYAAKDLPQYANALQDIQRKVQASVQAQVRAENPQLARALRNADAAYSVHVRNRQALGDARMPGKGTGISEFDRLPTAEQYERAHLAQRYYGKEAANKMLANDKSTPQHKVARDVARLTAEQHSPGTAETHAGMVRGEGSKLTDYIPNPQNILNKLGGKVAGRFLGTDPSTVIGRDSEFKNSVLRLMQQGGGEVPVSPLAARTMKNIFANPVTPKPQAPPVSKGENMKTLVPLTQISMWVNKLAGHPAPGMEQ